MQTRHYQSKSTARRWMLLGSFLVLIFSAYLSSTSIYAVTDPEVQFVVNVFDAISLQLVGSSIATDSSTGAQSLDLGFSPVSDGYFGSATMGAKVYTNNDTGYRLTMRGGSSTNALVNTENSSFTIPAMDTDTTVTTLDGTGFPVDSWGYTLDTSSPYNFTAMLDPTLTYPATLIASVDTAVPLGDTTDITFAAKANPATPPGTYETEVIFTATVDPVAEGVEPPVTTPVFYTITTMQEMDSTVCASVNTPTTSARGHADDGATYNEDLVTNGSTTLIPRTMLEDTRDHHMYIVEKLADDNCWMMENLALAGGTTITSEKSNLMPAGTGPNAAGTGNVTYTGSYTLSSSSDNMYNGTESAGVNTNYVFDFSALTTAEKTAKMDGLYNTTSHTGSYYSFGMAIAGDKGGASSSGGLHATEDICPKGWQLPTGGSSGQFQGLYNKYTNKTNFDQIWHMIDTSSYTGSYGYGSINNSGSSVVWLSRTYGPSSNFYILSEDTSSSIRPSGMGGFVGRFHVRCIAKK